MRKKLTIYGSFDIRRKLDETVFVNEISMAQRKKKTATIK